MKKLLTFTLLAAMALPGFAQEDLLLGKDVSVLGSPKTWTNANGGYTFDVTNNEHDLSKLTQDPRNTANIWIYPEGQNGGGFDSDDYRDANRAIGIQGFYIDMGSSNTVETVYTTWEGACATAYDIYLTANVPTSESALSNPAFSQTGLSGTEQTVNLKENNTGRYLVFQAKDATNYGWGVKIRSISAYGPMNKELTGFSVSPSIVPLSQPTPVTLSLTDQLGQSITEGYNITVSSNASYADGNLTINSGTEATVTATYDGKSLSATVYAASAPSIPATADIFVPVYTNGNQEKNASVEFVVDWNGGALNNGELSFPNGTVAQSFSNTRCVFFSNSETTGAWNGSINPSEKNYSFLNLDIFSGSDSKGYVDFEGTDGIIPQTFDFTLEAGKWTTVSVPILNETRLANMSVRFSEENACDILLANIYFKELKNEDLPVATSLEISVVPGGLFMGETAEVAGLVLDQYGNVMEGVSPVITVSGANYADGVITPTSLGIITIKATSGDVSVEKKIAVADADKYCMNGAKISSDTNASNPENAIDGGAQPDANGALFVISENESQGEHEHWILAELSRPYNLDLIALTWEGACPADYDVYVGESANNLTKLYSMSGHTQATWYDRFSGEEMNNVKFIKVITTKNATGYGIKLYEIKAYGTQAVASVATSLKIAVDKDYIATDESVVISGAVLDQYDGEIDGDITYYVNGNALEGNEFSAENIGEYVITAKSGSITSKELTMIVAAEKEIKLTKEDVLSAKIGDEDVNPFAGEIKLGEADSEEWEPLVIEFEYPMYFDLIRLEWEAACPSALEVKACYQFGEEVETIAKYSNRTLVMGVNPTDRLVNSRYVKTEPNGYDNLLRSNLEGITKLVIQPLAKDHQYSLRLMRMHLYGSADESMVSVEGLGNDVNAVVDVYTIQGLMVKKGVNAASATENLPAGVYIIGGKKVLVK